MEQPVAPTLKLKMGTKPPAIKIRLGGASKESPGPHSQPGTPDQRNSATPGVVVDPARQQGMNGAQSAGTPHSMSNPFGGVRPTSIPPLGQSYRRSGSAGSPPLSSNGVKTEGQTNYSPAPHSMRPTSTTPGFFPQGAIPASMLPPTSAARTMSGSPHPFAQQPYQQQYHMPAPVNGFEKKYRAPGKSMISQTIQ